MPDPQIATDDELVAMCLQGRREAWEALVCRYGPYVYGIATKAFRMKGDEAEEAFQTVFMKVYRNLDRYSGQGRFKTWLAQVVRNVCIDHVRAKARSGTHSLSSDRPGERMDELGSASRTTSPSVDDEISRIADRVTVRQALARLPMESRRLLYLRFYRDLPYNEIAKLTGHSEKVAAALTSRSLARLRQVLAEMEAVT